MTLCKKDLTFILEALTLGESARTLAPPNPWVGSVIVRDGKVISKGATSPYGGPHAEANALKHLGDLAKGATAYVTLEPCSHFGKTPPCVNALISSGISRVVVALKDPDPLVSGKGLQKLRDAGIQVDVGVGEKEAALSLAPYLHHRKTGLPYCLLKAAVSIDGRLSASDGTSQWITSSESRAEVQRIRSESQAIMIGAETAIRDKPKLNVRGVNIKKCSKPPLRVVLDSQARVPAEGSLFDTSESPTLFFTTVKTPNSWLNSSVEVIKVPKGAGAQGVDLRSCLEILAKRSILQLMVEGGGALFGSFLREGFINRLSLFQGACSLGEQGTPLFSGKGPLNISEAQRWNLLEIQQLGNDIKMDYSLQDV